MCGSDANAPSTTATRTAPRAAITRPSGAFARPRTRGPHQTVAPDADLLAGEEMVARELRPGDR